MTTRHIADEDVLQVIGCEIDKRPAAPGIDDLSTLVARVTRSSRELTVEFPAQARETVEAFADAERHCCSNIGWSVDVGSLVTLRIAADELALDAISQMFPTRHIDKAQ
jgi:hypothetical protein